MQTLDAALQKVLSVCACYYLAVFCVVGALRMSFPGALEWMESNVYYQMIRALTGQPLYTEPCLQYVPFPYPPFYFYTASMIARITGPDFLALRLVSYLSSLGSFAIIGYLVCKITGRRSSGLWAAGLFAATYNISATYFDIGRVDSLFLFLALGTLTSLCFTPGRAGCILAAVLLTAAALTKQTGLILILPLLLYAFLFRPRTQAFWFAGGFIALISLISLWLHFSSEGWFFFYTVTVPGQHQILWGRITSFFLQQLINPLPIAFSMGICSFFFIALKNPRSRIFLCALFCLAILMIACMNWLKIEAYKNVLLLAHAPLAIGVGITLNAKRENWIQRLLLIATCIQFGLLWYNPMYLVPARGSVELIHSTVAAIKKIDGEVFAPSNGYLPLLAGKSHSAHIACINDILLAEPGPVRDHLVGEITGALRNKRFKAVLLDRRFRFFQRELEANYIPSPEYAGRRPFRPLIKFWCIPRPPHP